MALILSFILGTKTLVVLLMCQSWFVYLERTVYALYDEHYITYVRKSVYI